jgi:hypothetical protein
MDNKKIFWMVGIVIVVLGLLIIIYLSNNEKKIVLADANISKIASQEEWCVFGDKWTSSKIEFNGILLKQYIYKIGNETVCVVLSEIGNTRFAFNIDEGHIYRYIFVNYTEKDHSYFQLISE